MAFLVVHYGPLTLRGYFHNYLRFNQRTSFITREYLDRRNRTIPLSCLSGEPAFYLFREEVSRKRTHLPHLPVLADIRSRKEWHKSGPETRQG